MQKVNESEKESQKLEEELEQPVEVTETVKEMESEESKPEASKSERDYWKWAMWIFVVIVVLVVGWVLLNSSSGGDSNEEIERGGASAPRDSKTLVVAEVGDDLAKDQEEYQEFIDYVSSKLGEYGVEKGEVATANTPAQMANLMRQGEVDIYFDSPFPAYIVSLLAEGEPLVNRWKKGVEKYHSVIFVRDDSEIENLDQLKGKMIVFEKPDSTSGYFLPKSYLLSQGYVLSPKESASDQVSADEIGYYFTYSDKDLIADVQNGVVVAGGQDEDELPEDTNWRFLVTTPDVFRHVLVVRGDMEAGLKNRLKEILLAMDKDPVGAEILADFKDTAKFSAFEPSAGAAFDEISSLSSLVEREIINE